MGFSADCRHDLQSVKMGKGKVSFWLTVSHFLMSDWNRKDKCMGSGFGPNFCHFPKSFDSKGLHPLYIIHRHKST